MLRIITVAWICVVVGCGRDEPRFISTLLPTDTTDTLGPYRIETEVYAPNGVYRLLARVEGDATGGGFGALPFVAIDETQEGGSFYVELPGRPVGTLTRYYLYLADGKRTGGGASVVLPDGAPETLAAFAIVAPAR